MDSALCTPIRSEADVAGLSDDERVLLARWLNDTMSRAPWTRRGTLRRRSVLLTMTVAAVCLVPWVMVLSTTLPSRYASQQWRFAWTGFDVALLLAFGVTAWAGWHNRQIVITSFVMLGTLLVCDAWFDITLSWRTGEQSASLLTAFLAELPLAVFVFLIAHRLIREMTNHVWRLEGRPDPVPPLHRLPLIFDPTN
jgi:hypothetical protein